MMDKNTKNNKRKKIMTTFKVAQNFLYGLYDVGKKLYNDVNELIEEEKNKNNISSHRSYTDSKTQDWLYQNCDIFCDSADDRPTRRRRRSKSK